MRYLIGCAELFRNGNSDVNQFTLAKQHVKNERTRHG